MASPRTPRHRRNASNSIDLSFATPLSYGNNSSTRRNSRTSIHSPTTPNPHHSLNRSNSIGIDVFGNGGSTPASNGLGNLADELADVWDEDELEGEYEEPDMNFHEDRSAEPTRDSGVDVSSSPGEPPAKPMNLTPPTPMDRGHRRAPSDYDGSEYGEDSDLESPCFPHGLVARMDQVESLARRGTENNGTDRDGVVKRVVDELKDLGSQSGVEGGATRLSTAHTALSTHLLHQTRLLQSLAYPLFAPLVQPPEEEVIDDLLPLLLSLNESMPRPTTAAFASLTQLHGLTADLVQTLNYLSDTLHMSRQTTTTATRRLRSARELVAEMKKEEEEREQGELWLQRGNWSERLGARECAGVCGDVVGGFEEVCNDWRARLLAQADPVGS